jgi:hypothetical protein
MKTKTLILIVLLSLIIGTSYAQQKTKKQLREVRKIEKQMQIKAMVDAKTFVFVGRTALSQGFNTIDLTSNPNYLQFEPALIKSEMPFFGRAFNGVGYGRDGGLKFEGTPEEFAVENRKKSFEIKATVKGETDVYRLFLTVFLEGNATLTISSNNRSAISYNGAIQPIEKNEDQ